MRAQSAYRPLLVGLIALLALLAPIAAGRAPFAAAQDATPAATAHPIVGAWQADLDADSPNNPPALVVFHADGTYLQTDETGVALGAWEATGERTATLTVLILMSGEDGGPAGHLTIRAAYEVAADGQSYAGSHTLEFVGGEGMPAGELGPGSATGTRIAVEPMGTPAASLAEAFGAPEAAATPAS